MSSITSVIPGDAQLSRLLASAASCGWNSTHDKTTALKTVATRCEWPAELFDAVQQLPTRNQRSLASIAVALLATFEHPEHADRYLSPLLAECRLTLTAHGVELTSGDRAVDIACPAVIGLLNLISRHGVGAVAICAWPTCSQPLIRTGRHHSSTACSARCANRTRVARHRNKTGR